MPIHVPGKRDHRNQRVKPTKRSVVAVLQLTAMVDMFTVLAVFLLQNYRATDQVLYLPEKVQLPRASAVRELKPSNVVIVAKDGIILNNEWVANYMEVKEQQDWMVEKLKTKLEDMIRKGLAEKESFGNRLKSSVVNAKNQGQADPDIDKFRKLTIQSDKSIDFLTVKKIMYTATEAGVYEINFAVLEKKDKIEK